MASKSLNMVQLIGNVTRDPELRYTPQGNAVATFGLATNRSWKTENGEIREEAEFHRLVAWNKLAELCSQLCTKGRKIYVQGRLQTRTFTGSDNAQHTITEIVIDDMLLLDSNRPVGGAYVPVGQVAEKSGSEEVETPAGDDLSAMATAASDDMEESLKKGNKNPSQSSGTLRSSAKPAGLKKKANTEPAVEEVKDNVNLDDIPF